MYVVHDCIKCKKQFILLENDLVNMKKLNNERYIACPYCRSKKN